MRMVFALSDIIESNGVSNCVTFLKNEHKLCFTVMTYNTKTTNITKDRHYLLHIRYKVNSSYKESSYDWRGSNFN